MQKLRNELTEWVRVLAGAFAVYSLFTTVAFANYEIPSESMVPALEVGDRIVVSKFSYGYSRHSLPFNIGALLPAAPHRLFEHMARRGDVIVFVHPRTGETMIKRAIGLPGDTIEMRGGMLWLNGAAVATTEQTPLLRRAHPDRVERAYSVEETLPGGVRHEIHDYSRHEALDRFGPYVVPAGHVFFMGDNRDNSLDSRWIGMGPVPMENLIGRAELIYFAPRGCDRDPGLACPRSRWLRPLRD